MKNKALTYGLLIVVAIIWYQVFFRVKGNLFGEDEALASTDGIRHELPSLARDTVDLKVNYRDPFGMIKKSSQSVQLNDGNIGVAKPRPKPPKPQTVWPSLKYFGLVQKTHSKKPLAIVSVDGIQLMLRKGEEVFDGIYIVKIERDVITIRYRKEIKEVFR